MRLFFPPSVPGTPTTCISPYLALWQEYQSRSNALYLPLSHSDLLYRALSPPVSSCLPLSRSVALYPPSVSSYLVLFRSIATYLPYLPLSRSVSLCLALSRSVSLCLSLISLCLVLSRSISPYWRNCTAYSPFQPFPSYRSPPQVRNRVLEYATKHRRLASCSVSISARTLSRARASLARPKKATLRGRPRAYDISWCLRSPLPLILLIS